MTRLRYAAVGLLLFADVVGANDEEILWISKDVAVATLQEIEPAELWHAAPPRHVVAPSGFALTFWAADAEGRTKQHGLERLGFALTGIGDVGEKPAGFFVLSRTSSTLVRTRVSTPSEGTTSVEMIFAPARCGDPRQCAKLEQSLRVNYNSATAVVTVNGKQVGVVR